MHHLASSSAWVRVAFMVAIAASMTAPAMSQPAPADRAQVERGRAAYVSKGCYECHGHVGQGSIMSGPALARLPIPIEGLDAYVRAPAGQMPPYSKKILNDADLRDIHAFLMSLQSPPGSP